MIIAAYAGTGKSYLAKIWDKAVEIPSMPYAWILPDEDPNKNYELEKAAKYHVRNPLFPCNMLKAILEAEQKHDVVIIPTVNAIIDILQERYARKIVLCYPNDGLEEEYRTRYIKRGNSDDFLELFADHMQLFIEPLQINAKAHHIVLQRGEYLVDHLGDLERLRIQEKTIPVSLEQIGALENMLNVQSKNNGLVLLPLRKRKTVACMLPDLEDNDLRCFVYACGRKLGSELCSLLMIVNGEMIKELETMGDLLLLDRDAFAQEIDEWLCWNMGYFPMENDCFDTSL